MSAEKKTKTFKLALYPKPKKKLKVTAGKVDRLWNHSCDVQLQNLLRFNAGETEYQRISQFSLGKIIRPEGKRLGLRSDIIEELAARFVINLKESPKPYLKYRNEQNPYIFDEFWNFIPKAERDYDRFPTVNRKNGWIPFRGHKCRIIAPNRIRLFGVEYQTHNWFDELFLGTVFRDGCSFSEKHRGKWELSLKVRQEFPWDFPGREEDRWLGIDPGMKNIITLSNGRSVPPLRLFRDMKNELALLQSQGRMDEYARIHNELKHQREDFCKKEAAKIADAYKYVAFGDWSIGQAARKKGWSTAILDSGCGKLKLYLKQFVEARGGVFIEVNEKNTTRTCFACGEVNEYWPTDRNEALALRKWDCPYCGTHHDRDINAAKNIAERGRILYEESISEKGIILP